MTNREVLIEFKKQIICFLDELINQFPNEGDLVVFRLFLENQIPIENVMQNFKYQLNKDNCKIKNMIKERNQDFFINYEVFSGNCQQEGRISHFKKIWLSGQLDKEDKEVIWKWMDAFAFLSEQFTN